MKFDVTKLKPDNAKAIGIILVVIVVLILASYWISKYLGGVGELFGNIKDFFSEDPAKAQKKQDIQNAAEAAASPTSPWSPQFYKTAPSGAKLLTSAFADQLAKQIWDTIPWFYLPPPDAGPAEAALKQCATQSQISFLADRFNSKYGTDLYTWLTRTFAANLDSPGVYTMDVINKYVSNLPKYN